MTYFTSTNSRASLPCATLARSSGAMPARDIPVSNCKMAGSFFPVSFPSAFHSATCSTLLSTGVMLWSRNCFAVPCSGPPSTSTVVSGLTSSRIFMASSSVATKNLLQPSFSSAAANFPAPAP